MAKVLLEICCGSAEDAIVAAQNGTVTAENDPARGARFKVRFYKSVI